MNLFHRYIVLSIVLLFLACTRNSSDDRIILSIEENDTIATINFFPEFPSLTKDYIIATRAFANRFYLDQINKDQYSGSFLVAKNGKIIYERTSGFFNKSDRRKLKPDDPIHVASISKVATAIQILRYCDQGLIDLDADVKEYLPDLPYDGITVRMLLNHRSGLPYYGYFSYTSWNLNKALKNSDILALMKRYRYERYFPPGKKFAYCNTNYVLLALIAEKVSGKKFPQLMKEEMFDPLGMENSFIMDHTVDQRTVCQSYNSKYQIQNFNFLDAIYGDKNMYTTARDLLKLDKATYSNTFLSDSLKKQMFRGYSFEKRGIVNYGLGIRMYLQPDKEPFYFHTGWWHGNTGCYATLRSDTLCIIAIANKYTHTVYKVRNLTPYFGDYPADFKFE